MTTRSTFPEELCGRFEPGPLLGAGASARVFRARDRESGETVALKIFSPRGDWRVELPRFLQEAEQAKRFEHPHLVPVLDFDVHPGRTSWIAYRYIPGATLRTHMDRGDHDAAVLLEWLAQVAEALAALHREGLAHRDVKPENILIRDDGRAFLADLGMLRLPRSRIQTTTGTLHGTPHYIAPELWQGEQANAASDQFSLGVVLLEAVHGRKAYPGDSLGTIFAWAQGEGELELPAACSPVTRRALARDPAARHRDLLELARALRSPPLLEATRTRIAVRRRARTRGYLGVAALGFGLLGAAAFWLRGRAPPAPPSLPEVHRTVHVERTAARVRTALAALRDGHPGDTTLEARTLGPHLRANRGFYMADSLPRQWRNLLEAMEEWGRELEQVGPDLADTAEQAQLYREAGDFFRHGMNIFRRMEGKRLGFLTGLAYNRETLTRSELETAAANWKVISEQSRVVLDRLSPPSDSTPDLVLALAGDLAKMLDDRRKISLAPILRTRILDRPPDAHSGEALWAAFERVTLGPVDLVTPRCENRVAYLEDLTGPFMTASPGSPWAEKALKIFLYWLHTARSCDDARAHALARVDEALERIRWIEREGRLVYRGWTRLGFGHYVGVFKANRPEIQARLEVLAGILPPGEDLRKEDP